VEATFKAKRNMVANNSTEGKDENSRGLRVPMAIMMMTKLMAMLKVKNTSNKIAGMGKTNIATISKTKAGMPKPASSMRATCCRIVDRFRVLMGESVVEEGKKPKNAP
jgi:hypothetical protein